MSRVQYRFKNSQRQDNAGFMSSGSYSVGNREIEELKSAGLYNQFAALDKQLSDLIRTEEHIYTFPKDKQDEIRAKPAWARLTQDIANTRSQWKKLLDQARASAGRPR